MGRAFITTFHNYSKSFNTEYYKIFYDYFVEQFPLWCDLVNTVYIIETNWGFTDEDKKRLTDIKKEIVFYKSPLDAHHNRQYQEFLPQIKEDEMLFMDNDVFITKRSGISSWFYLLKEHEAVITFAPWEKYPPGDLRNPIWNKFPEINKRGVYMESCHFLITRKLLDRVGKVDMMNYQPYKEGTYIKQLDYHTKKGDWCEFFAHLWLDILEGKNWIENTELDGCNHIRACSYAYLLLSCKKTNAPQYKEFIKTMRKSDIIKRLSWFYHIDTKGKYHEETLSVANDFGIKDGELLVAVYQLKHSI